MITSPRSSIINKPCVCWKKPEEKTRQDLFRVLYSLATTNRLKEDNEQALAYGYRAAALAKTLSSAYQEVCYTMLGNILDDQRNDAPAIYNYQRALALGADRLGNDDPALIIRLNNLAAIYIQNRQPIAGNAAIGSCATDLPRFQNDRTKADIASTYEYLGDAYAKEGKADSASVAYHRSLVVNRKVHGSHHPNTTDILSTLGKFYQKRARYDSALHYFQQALRATVPEFQPAGLLQNPAGAHDDGRPVEI